MAALSATDWTLTLLPTQGTASGAPQARGIIMGKQRTHRIRMTLSATTGAFYPSGNVGIPMPTYGATTPGQTYGMVRNVDYMNVYSYPSPTTEGGIIWQMTASGNPGHHRIRGYVNTASTAAANAVFNPLPTTWNPSDVDTAGLSFYVEVKGW